MAVNLKYIQFKHLLFDASNAPIDDVQVIVQFYNVNVKSWMSLTDELRFRIHGLQHQLEIPSRISTDDQTIRIVREVLKSGGIPSFRLIKADKRSDIPQVIASNFKAIIEGESLLTIDFDKSWLLKADAVIQKADHVIIASQVPVFELTNIIREIEQQKDEALAQVLVLNTTIASLVNEKDLLNSELLTVRDQFIEMEQLTTDLNISLNAAHADLASEQTLRETLETKQIILETQVASQQEQIAIYEAQAVENFKGKYFQLKEQFIVINQEKENLTQEKVSFLASIDQLQKVVKQEKQTIEIKDAELHTKQVLIKTLEKQTLTLQKELEEAIDYNATAHPNKLSASKVYGSIVNDVIKADEELVNSRYKLGNISLNLKTTVEKGPEGTVFGLLDFETAKGINGAAISDISIDIVPNVAAAINEGQKMPDILGLTETAVRKVLLNNGLKLDAVYHPTKDPNLVAGQSFKQSPAPNASIAEGQEVIVIFAKPIN